MPAQSKFLEGGSPGLDGTTPHINMLGNANSEGGAYPLSAGITDGGEAAIIAAMATTAIRSSNPDRPYLEVGQRIEAVRLYAGLTVIEMAALMKIGQSRYTVLQYGRALPDAEKLEPLCLRYGVTLDWLYRGDMRLLPYALVEELERHRLSLNEHGHPHKRPPGRPAGTGTKSKRADKPA